MAFDLDGIRRSVTISDAAARFGVKVIRDGGELKACCPFHTERAPSFTIFNGKDGVQRFQCFGCGEKGDVVDFTMKIKGVDLREAARILGGADGVLENRPPVDLPKVDHYAGIEPVPFSSHPFKVGVETALYNPKRDTVSGFEPTHVHEYRDEQGSCYALVLRRSLPDGKKETPSVARVKLADGCVVWSRFPIRSPKLYGIERVAQAHQVIVVEGEKCADVWNALPGRCAVSWPSGGSAWDRVDWSSLAGKDVILWADHDKPGSKTMHGVARTLAEMGCRVRMIDTFVAGLDLPSGYDCADVFEAGGVEALYAFLREHLAPFVEPQPEPAPEPELPSNVIPLSSRERPPQAPIEQLIQEEQTVANFNTGEQFAGPDTWRALLIMKEKGGKIEAKLKENIMLFVEFHPEFAGLFVYDEALDNIMVMRRPVWEPDNGTWKPRPMQDRDIERAHGLLERLELRPGPGVTRAAIQTVAKSDRVRVNSLKDELRTLQWDGTPRLEALFSHYCGSRDSLYNRIVAKRFMVQAVRRAMEPGCKAELMLILEGSQGAGKTTFCQILAGSEKWAGELKSIDSKDDLMIIAGKWIIEMPELVAHSKSDVNRQKAFFSETVNRYRPPYGATVIEQPRQCVFIGTHNPKGSGYLKDETGARRFLPVKVGRIDFDALRADRDQIVAEAMHLLSSGETSWLTDQEREVAATEQAIRTARDPWLGYIAEKIRGQSHVKLHELHLVVGLQREQLNAQMMERLSSCMWQLGWEQLYAGAEVVFRPKSQD